jgi:hypothetical protein
LQHTVLRFHRILNSITSAFFVLASFISTCLEIEKIAIKRASKTQYKSY